jgi:Spx/MgsR family transcriptional regulator
MIMIHLYGVPTCKQIRDSKTLFAEQNIEYEFTNVKKKPLTLKQLEDAASQIGLENLINSKGPTYRKLGLKNMNLSDKELLQWLLKEQGMIKRPLIHKNGKYWGNSKGFNKEAILDFIRQG